MRTLLALTTLLLSAAPAYAEDVPAKSVSVTVYASLKTGYDMNDVGIHAYQKPVVQSGVTVTLPNGLWADVWNSTPLSAKKADVNSYAEETDFTIGYDHTFGRVEVSASVAYYLLQPYSTTNDDVIQVNVRAAVPIKVGKLTLKPYIQPFMWVGTPDFPTHAFLRVGIAPSVELKGWMLSGDIARVQKLVRGPQIITPDAGVWRFDVGASRSVGKGWNISGSISKSAALPVVLSIGFSKTL